MITKEAIDLARKATRRSSMHQGNAEAENGALHAIGAEIARLAQFGTETDADEAIDQAVARYSGVGLDRELAEHAYHCVIRQEMLRRDS
ncbi:hypothetical protein [Halomonas sp. WWR20]